MKTRMSRYNFSLLKKLLIFYFFITLNACSFNYQLNPVLDMPDNIVGIDNSKIPGMYALILDESLINAKTELRSSTYAGAAWTWNIDLGDQNALLVRKALESRLEKIKVYESIPSLENLNNIGAIAVIYASMAYLIPNIYFGPFREADEFDSITDQLKDIKRILKEDNLIVTTAMSYEFTVKDIKGNLLFTMNPEGHCSTSKNIGYGLSVKAANPVISATCKKAAENTILDLYKNINTHF